MTEEISKDRTTNNDNVIDFSTLLPQGGKLESVVRQWLDEDIPSFDVGGLVVGKSEKEATLYMKSSGVLAGKPFVDTVFQLLNCKVEWTAQAIEGHFFDVTSNDKLVLAKVSGPVNAILQGERTALNILSRCSGVATTARLAVEATRNWSGYVSGTRKTTPGFRLVEKYALMVGGAATHRLDLSQMVMLKDNHVWATGNITKAVQLAKQACGFSQKIQVECRSIDEARQAAEAGADVVMLDNFTPDQLKADAQTLKSEYPHVLIEASGGITTENMSEYLSEHVDIVSQGKLTQGYSCLDFSLKISH